MRKTVLLSLFIFASLFISTCFGHAALVKPTPYNLQPSTAKPCGGGTPQTNPQAVLCSGQKNAIVWRVSAGDGAGPVTASLNTNGEITEFPVSLTVSGTVPDKVATFDLQIDIPSGTTCNNGRCVLQVQAAGWYSCSTIDIKTDCTEQPKNLVPTEININSNVDFCTKFVNRVVLIPTGQTPEEIDKAANKTFYANLGNEKVFGNGNSYMCKQQYADIICAASFPLAPGSDGNSTYPITQGQCERFAQTCDLKPEHQTLYDCSTYPQDNSSSSLLPSIFIAFLLAISSLLFL
eukprot:gene7868-9685_t